MKTNQPHIWIVGLGAISGIGQHVHEHFSSLQQAKDGIAFPSILETYHKQTFPVAEVKYSNHQLAERCGLPLGLSRTIYLSAIAAQEALQDAQLSGIDSSVRIGFISGNTVGGMDLTEHFFQSYLTDHTQGHLREVIHHESGSVTEVVAQHLGLTRYFTTFSTACSSSANSIMHAARMIQHGKLDIAIAGGCDSLCRFTLNGFNTLMILDTQPCTPWDDQRKGLNLGEGAGYVVLMSDAMKNQLGAKTYARITGYANANDAFHQTASSPEGTGNYLAMKGALDRSGLNPSDIGYINLHGTGTANNDSSEALAIQRLFNQDIPLLSSTKSFTGHTLGACGGLEAVFSCLALTHQCVFPSLRFTTPMKEAALIPVTTFKATALNHVMSNSFGFGGNCSSLIFSQA